MGHPTKNQLPISLGLAELLASRIVGQVEKTDSGCWIRSRRAPTQTGYTHITRTANGVLKYYLAHRVMYVAANGQIPGGYTIDHLCGQPACCNPDHLRAVPHHANVLRSKTNFYAVNAQKTHCIRGHELPPYELGKTRNCPPCVRIRQAEFYARQRAQRGVA